MGVYCNFYIFDSSKIIPCRKYCFHNRSIALFFKELNIGVNYDEEYYLQKEHMDLLLNAYKEHSLPRSLLTPPDERPISHEDYLLLGVIKDFIDDGYIVIYQVSE